MSFPCGNLPTGGGCRIEIRSEDPFEEGAGKIRVAEAYFSLPLARGVGMAIGRQRFSDERDWHYSTNNLDAVRVLAEFYPFAFEASFSSDVFDEHRNRPRIVDRHPA